MREEDSATEQDEALQKLLTEMLDESCPTKTVRLRMSDKPYITKELKTLDRQRKREYTKHGKSNRYISINKRYNQKLELAASEYLNKNVRAISESEPGKAYSLLKRLGAQPGDLLDAGSFQIEEH